MNSFMCLNLWFRDRFGLDLRSLAFFRMGLGTILLYDLIHRFGDLESHYSDSGVLPRWTLAQKVIGTWDLSVHFISGNYFFIAIIFLAASVCALCVLLGYKTRLFIALSWILLVSLHNRNPLVLQSGDHLIKMLLFWAFFLPVSERFSLSQPSVINANKKIFNIASFGLIMQIVSLYLLAGFSKLAERHWLGGDALFLAFASRDLNTSLGQSLLASPWFLLMADKVTLIGELFIPLLIWIPWKNAYVRLFLIVGFVSFHLSILFTLKVAIFVFAPMIAWSALLPGFVWDKVSYFKAFDVCVTKIFNQLRAFLGLALTLQRKKNKSLSVAKNYFLSLCLILLSYWTYYTLPGLGRGFPKMFEPFFISLGLPQSYGVFAVTLPRSGWFWIPAQLNNGEKIELSIDGRERPFRLTPPDMDQYNRINDRWGKYIESLAGGFSFLRENEGFFLCNKWNSTHSKERQVETFTIHYVTTKVRPDGTYGDRLIEALWTHECVDGALKKWKNQFTCQLPGEQCRDDKK